MFFFIAFIILLYDLEDDEPIAVHSDNSGLGSYGSDTGPVYDFIFSFFFIM
jgi:hypothetical protein